MLELRKLEAVTGLAILYTLKVPGRFQRFATRVLGPDAARSDRTKLKQVLLNLLSNAMKFTNKGGVSIVVRPHAMGVRVDINDTGIGIKPEHLSVIWEDFRQVDQSRTREYGGTGLGLSITRKLVERLGGTISVESILGVGTSFTIMLPLAAPQQSVESAGDVTGA